MSHVKFLFCRFWEAVNRKRHDNSSTKKEVSEKLLQRTKRDSFLQVLVETLGRR